MGDEGNDFVNLLQWPSIQPMLNVQLGQRILDIACGNGLYSRRLAALGAQVTAFEFSEELVRLARRRDGWNMTYQVLEARDEGALLSLGERFFDSVLCNMGFFVI